MKKLAWRKPLYALPSGAPVEVMHRYKNGNLVVERGTTAITVDAYGYGVRRGDKHQLMVVNAIPESVEYLSLYPTGSVYRRSDAPVKTSSYGVENLIQIKVTRRGDKIIKKEFV